MNFIQKIKHKIFGYDYVGIPDFGKYYTHRLTRDITGKVYTIDRFGNHEVASGLHIAIWYTCRPEKYGYESHEKLEKLKTKIRQMPAAKAQQDPLIEIIRSRTTESMNRMLRQSEQITYNSIELESQGNARKGDE